MLFPFNLDVFAFYNRVNSVNTIFILNTVLYSDLGPEFSNFYRSAEIR